MLGGVLSLLKSSPFIAVASATAFVVAELFDLGVYTPLREKGRHIAVMASGVVGAFVDSLLFVWIAFGSLDLSLGTAVAKIYASFAVAIILYFIYKKKINNDTLSRDTNY